MACVGRSKQCTLVPPNHLGPIPGVEVGSQWKFRVQVLYSVSVCVVYMCVFSVCNNCINFESTIRDYHMWTHPQKGCMHVSFLKGLKQTQTQF